MPLFADHGERKLDAAALNNQGTCGSDRITPPFIGWLHRAPGSIKSRVWLFLDPGLNSPILGNGTKIGTRYGSLIGDL